MGKKINKIQFERNVLKAINQRIPYVQISKKFGISKSTISRIKARNDPEVKKARKLKRQEKEFSQKQKIAISRSMIKNGELIVQNLVRSLNVIVFGVEKLYGIVEDAENRLNVMQSDLEKLVKQIDGNMSFSTNKKGKQPERDAIIKKIYTVLGQLSQFYAINKILIDGVNGMRQHVETYTKLRIEEQAISGLKEFFDAMFEGFNLLDDESYVRVRDFIISRSELGRQLFKSFDTEVI